MMLHKLRLDLNNISKKVISIRKYSHNCILTLIFYHQNLYMCARARSRVYVCVCVCVIHVIMLFQKNS